MNRLFQSTEFSLKGVVNGGNTDWFQSQFHAPKCLILDRCLACRNFSSSVSKREWQSLLHRPIERIKCDESRRSFIHGRPTVTISPSFLPYRPTHFLFSHIEIIWGCKCMIARIYHLARIYETYKTHKKAFKKTPLPVLFSYDSEGFIPKSKRRL